MIIIGLFSDWQYNPYLSKAVLFLAVRDVSLTHPVGIGRLKPMHFVERVSCSLHVKKTPCNNCWWGSFVTCCNAMQNVCPYPKKPHFQIAVKILTFIPGGLYNITYLFYILHFSSPEHA